MAENEVPSENPAPAPGDNLSAEEIQKQLSEQIEKHKIDFLYLRAEFENYKKHNLKERSDLIKYGSERVARDLLSVLDNFDRALAVEIKPDTIEQFYKGVQLTANDLKALLSKHGVTEVPTQGAVFDPNFHEALTSESSDEVPAGHVLRVFQKAYKLHDKLIRPAQVVVAKKD
jgi:molecular chaperone GrpE